MKANATNRVAANIRAEVARQRIGQAALAAQLNMSQQAVSRRLLGQTALTVDELEAFARVLAVDVASLLADNTPKAATA